MILAFTLSMPRANSWNGRWSGESRLHCKLVAFRGVKREKKAVEIAAAGPYHYNWGDGWGAMIEVQAVDGREAARLRKRSDGFCGYDWMVDTIISHGKPLATHELPKVNT